MLRLGVLLCVFTTISGNLVQPRQIIEPRIVNGLPAMDGQFPWQAAIYISTLVRDTFCGGSLITERWVLTAAHCVIDAHAFTVYLGSVSLTRYDDNRLIVETSISIPHPEYNRETLENDLGLIDLIAPVVVSDFIKPIAFESTYLSTSLPVIIAGWGKTSDASDTLSESLQYITLVTITNGECSSYYDTAIAAKMVCAVGIFQSTCGGDSGGPLVKYNDDEEVVQVGIATFVSSAGCDTTYPSGYTRTGFYLDWINNTIAENS